MLPFCVILTSKKYLYSLCCLDPFDEVSEGDETSVQVDDIHIRIQQRNGRKTLTTIQGISDEYDLKKILRQFKKVSFSLYIMSLFNLQCTYQKFDSSMLYKNNVVLI